MDPGSPEVLRPLVCTSCKSNQGENALISCNFFHKTNSTYTNHFNKSKIVSPCSLCLINCLVVLSIYFIKVLVLRKDGFFSFIGIKLTLDGIFMYTFFAKLHPTIPKKLVHMVCVGLFKESMAPPSWV